MKTLHVNFTAWAIATLVSGSSIVACAQATTGASMTKDAPDSAKTMFVEPLQKSVTTLKKLVASGDPDFDFSFQAKAYTQGIQDIIKKEIQNGKDSATVSMAKAMLPTADADMTLINATMRQVRPTRPNQDFTDQQSKNIEAMRLKLSSASTGSKLSSNVDENFATLLADNRQDGIDMATTYLKYGKNATLRSYAQRLIDTSTKQIESIKTKQMQKVDETKKTHQIKQQN